MVIWLISAGVIVIYIKILQLKTFARHPLRLEFGSLQGVFRSLQIGSVQLNFEDKEPASQRHSQAPVKKARK